MPDPYLVKPDRDFLHRIVGDGGEDLKQCFQCATCSVVCELSNGEKPFPRKEMIWTQWGLRDRLLADPDIWMCYQCGDCSRQCPRAARPGDVMAALRRESVVQYAVPRLLANWLSQPKFLPLVVLIPAVLLGAAFLARKPLEAAGTSKIAHPYSNMLPHWLSVSIFGLLTALVLAAVVAGVVRFWRAMKAADVGRGIATPAKGLWRSIGSALKSVLVHDKFNMCTAERPRLLSHMLAFYGFLALVAVAIWVLISISPLVREGFVYPFSLWSPWRILANLGGLAVVAGCALMIRERLRKSDEGDVNTFFDWAFLWTLLGVVLTGFVAEVMHYFRMDWHRHLAYYVHLVFVFGLFMYLPYSKFAHLIYRTTALVYAEHTGRSAEVPPAAPDPGGESGSEQTAPEEKDQAAKSTA
ncbi:MAG: quinone-interacting membrane-bound oxidoreductase complex subunit QmoC [Planctomycetota bacterium]|jgi:quinone-modifying oxidoreductase subunit QmoC